MKNPLQPGDVIMTSEAPLGELAYLDDSRDWVLGQRLFALRPNKKVLCGKFLYYALATPDVRERIAARASGTTVQGIRQAELRKVDVPVPPLKDQVEAATILSSLDDRLDNLRQTNATLEAIAQALFKSWFVDFDPVSAKAKGREPEGMDAGTAALFPSEFEDSDLGPIPQGWRSGCLREICRTHDSKRVPLSSTQREKRRGRYPYYGAASIMDYIDDYLFDGIYVLLAEDGSVATKKGYALTQYVWGRIWVNNHAHVLEGHNGCSTEQLLLFLQQVRIGEFITGAVQAKLSQANMFRIPAVIPDEPVFRAFAECIQPLFSAIRNNCDRQKALEGLRDTLLPRLISGKLRLPEAEAEVEALA